MKVSVSLDLESSREKVWEMFDSFENAKLWQPTLVKTEHVSGKPGQVGAVSKLTYDEDGREEILEETITLRDQPREFSGIYEGDSVTNRIHNLFVDLGNDRTRWTLESEFEFRGIYKLASIFMGGAIRKRTEQDMQRFKELVEGG